MTWQTFLKQHMKAKGWNAVELAEATFGLVSVSAVHAWQQGARLHPQPAQRALVEKALGAEWDEQ